MYSIFEKDLTGSSKYERALEAMRVFCVGKRVLLAFSGGKDSQCCYYLLKAAGVAFEAQYSITRFEPPQLLDFVRANYPEVKMRRAFKQSLIDEIAAKGLPTRWVRWCCEAKHRPTPGFDISVIGVRAEESTRRRKTWHQFGFKPGGEAYICPIIDWSTTDVWELLDSVGAPHCELYDPPFSFHRIGCVCCPLAPRNMGRDAELWPKTARMLRKGGDAFVARMRSQGFLTRMGRPCPSWCRAESPEEEYFTRWIQSGQTTKPLRECDEPENVDCPFFGSGFAEADGGETGDNEYGE